MKEFCLALLEAANKLHPMRGVRDHGEWYWAGCFTFQGKLYSFMIHCGKGTWRRMDGQNYPNEWFDIRMTANKFTFIVYNGVKYDANPVLDL
jgi:hypothetical protein